MQAKNKSKLNPKEIDKQYICSYTQSSMDSSDSPNNLHHQAINAALNSNWNEALKLNRLIIRDDPSNVDALNRLARANFELGKLSLAKKFYSEALKFDPYNPIAIKNLKIIKAFKKEDFSSNQQTMFEQNHNGHAAQVLASMFLQEPGKTKIVNLIKVAEPQKLSRMFCGMTVDLVVKNRKLTVVDPSGVYLGAIPDDVSFKLMRLIAGGNKYQVFIKSIRFNAMSVLIKETLRSKKFRNQPSFLEASTHQSTPDLIAPIDQDADEVETEEEIES